MTSNNVPKVWVRTAIAIIAAGLFGCADSAPSTSEVTGAVIDGQRAQPGELEGVVKTSIGCSAALIANDTVLTAAHCVCDNGTCVGRETIRFRDPQTGEIPEGVTQAANPTLVHSGTVFHLDTTFNVPGDIALIKLDTPAPWFVQPFTTARTNPPEGSPVVITGYGRLGSDCGTENGKLFYSRGKHIDDYVQNMARYYDEVVCPGDSGGPHLLDTGGPTASFQVVALASGTTWTFPHGQVDLAATTAFNDGWIKGLICTSSSQNLCSAPPGTDICDCSASTSIVWMNTNKQVALWQLDGNRFTEAFPRVLPGTFQIWGAGDFDGDGFQDLLLRDATGQVQIWRLDASGNLVSAANVGGTDPTHQWAIQTVADFDGNGRSDILWRATNGQLAIWLNGDINTATFPSYQNSGAPADLHWSVLGAADFDGDGNADILWRNGNALAIWRMHDGAFLQDLYPASVANGTVFQGLGDFNGDGRADILWRRQTFAFDPQNGMLEISFGGFAVAPGPAYQNATTSSLPSPASPAYEIIGIGDVDHDGRDDLIWRDASHNGYISIWLLDGVRFIGDYQARGVHDSGPRFVDPSWTSFRTLRERGF